ncbi:hypothetical protein ACQR1W_08660 [Bradyrhizobium sp. HKCCYLS1011]|uniref:hypothetical protein n=1 Tax=Bradyrhizobium sp. HKCCYLS1011 TaxID=3420733 RepID=UPI003EC02963
MSAKSKRGKVTSCRKNPETGQLEFYEMTPEDIEDIFHALEQLPPAKAQEFKTVAGEAKRGTRHAQRFLAESPTQEDIQDKWDWTWDETDMNSDCPASLAYDEAYRRALRGSLT